MTEYLVNFCYSRHSFSPQSPILNLCTLLLEACSCSARCQGMLASVILVSCFASGPIWKEPEHECTFKQLGTLTENPRARVTMPLDIAACDAIILQHRKVSDRSMQRLARALKGNTKIREISLVNIGGFGDDGIEALGQVLADSSVISTFSIYGPQATGFTNQCTALGVAKFAAGLAQNTGLERMRLNDFFDDDGAAHLAAALAKHPKIEELRLDHNVRLGDRGAVAIANALMGNTMLTHLVLVENRIGDEGAAALARMVSALNKTLAFLSLGDNAIGDAGAVALAATLSGKNKLTALDLMENEIGDVGARALAEALKSNVQLESIMIKGNLMSDAAYRGVLSALEHGDDFSLHEGALSEDDFSNDDL